MLCATLSSLMKTRVSPFLSVTLVSENFLPFWLIVCSAAASATPAPARKASARMQGKAFTGGSCCVDVMARRSTRTLSRQHRHIDRIGLAGERQHEGDEVGLLLR